MNILIALVFAIALFLSILCAANTADSCANGTQRDVTIPAVLTALAWGLFYYLTH
jgi:hypothetical protein